MGTNRVVDFVRGLASVFFMLLIFSLAGVAIYAAMAIFFQGARSLAPPNHQRRPTSTITDEPGGQREPVRATPEPHFEGYHYRPDGFLDT